MVRLKVTEQAGGYQVHVFQFQMVRLKELRANRLRGGVQFQFQMVRLKAFLILYKMAQRRLFQFQMVRLKG